MFSAQGTEGTLVLLVRADSFGVKGSPQMTMQIKMADFAFTFGQRSQKCAFITLTNGNGRHCDTKKKKKKGKFDGENGSIGFN